MTAMAAGLALVPIALGMGKPGSEIQAPMAIAISTGLVTSSALYMAVVPAAFYHFWAGVSLFSTRFIRWRSFHGPQLILRYGSCPAAVSNRPTGLRTLHSTSP